MDSGEQGEITRVLEAVHRGERGAERALFDQVYQELRGMARGQLRKEIHRPTLLQTTALVHEAWMRLAGNQQDAARSRRYFFAAAREAMRRILIDYARERKAQRRGGGAPRVSLADAASDAPDFDLLALDEALTRLAAFRPRAAEAVAYRFFLGLSVPETAEQMEISARTVNLDWTFARRWLERELAGDAR
jgi:RNA polymerase sigma factor (TIGR02999 family)